MRWAAVAPGRTIHCVQPRPLATKACPLHVDDNRNLERHVQSQGALERGKVARHAGAVQAEGQRIPRRGRPGRWSGYDASEAKSVHRESLWNPKRESGRPGHLAKRSVTARPLPSSQLPKAPAVRGPGPERISRCPLDMPRCANVWQSASSSRQPEWAARGLHGRPVTHEAGADAPARAARQNPNGCMPCVEPLWLPDSVPNDDISEASRTRTCSRCQRSWRFGVFEAGWDSGWQTHGRSSIAMERGQ